jgi:hypothetical protein
LRKHVLLSEDLLRPAALTHIRILNPPLPIIIIIDPTIDRAPRAIPDLLLRSSLQEVIQRDVALANLNRHTELALRQVREPIMSFLVLIDLRHATAGVVRVPPAAVE